MNEFEIIRQFFTPAIYNSYIQLGVGDDAAILRIPPEYELVSSIDTSINGVHFPTTTAAYDIGHKSLAVSLSDMAAMGAQPISVLLALSLPKIDIGWLKDFSQGFLSLAAQYDVSLIGGDLTRGPLTITTQVNGIIPRGKALCRHHAQFGDNIYVTGYLGDAGYALKLLQEKTAAIPVELLKHLNRPCPRVDAGLTLRNHIHAAIDLSDGLAADLQHILQASHCGAEVFVDTLPISTTLQHIASPQECIYLALCAGDDYELCFTAASTQHSLILAQLAPLPVTCIGKITDTTGLKFFDQHHNPVIINHSGYQHFG